MYALVKRLFLCVHVCLCASSEFVRLYFGSFHVYIFLCAWVFLYVRVHENISSMYVYIYICLHVCLPSAWVYDFNKNVSIQSLNVNGHRKWEMK